MTTVQIPQRMNFATAAPKVFRAVLALDAAARQGLDPVLVELVQIRVSQINRCAYCIDYHAGDARKAGESEEHPPAERLGGVLLYTAEERAALALAESVTLLPQGVSDAVYAEAAQHFDEQQLAQLIALVFTANAWNRMNVTTRKTPGTA
ncbi:carboxymuconolactone decarboxylase family protein [Kitasatospora aburaviensis]